MMKKILVPTDFSDYSEFAGDVAIKLAPKMNAVVHFFHRIQVNPMWEKLTEAARLDYPESQARIETVKANFKELRKRYEDTHVRIVTTYSTGDIIQTVADYIDAEGIDMIVMGSMGADGIKEWMFGSNAQKIVRHAHCPVMVIKHPLEDFSFKNLVFASDFQDAAKRPFEQLIDFGRHFGSHIHLVNIAAYPRFDVTEEDLARMKEFEKMSHVLPCTLHGMGDIGIEEGITHFAREHEVDMVTIASYGKSPLKRILTGSVTESLVNHLEIPVMTINTRELKTWTVVKEEEEDTAKA